jgi:hypothetical protein
LRASEILEYVFQHQPCPVRNPLLGENLRAQREDVLCPVKLEVLDQESDVLGAETRSPG